MIKSIKELPKGFQKDIKKAKNILTQVGCTEIYLFGSLINGKIGKSSDIDIAIKGCPHEQFFKVYGKLIMDLDHKVDLFDLDPEDPFTDFLTNEGLLLLVA